MLRSAQRDSKRRTQSNAVRKHAKPNDCLGVLGNATLIVGRICMCPRPHTVQPERSGAESKAGGPHSSTPPLVRLRSERTDKQLGTRPSETRCRPNLHTMMSRKTWQAENKKAYSLVFSSWVGLVSLLVISGLIVRFVYMPFIEEIYASSFVKRITINLSGLLTFFAGYTVINWLLREWLGGRSLVQWVVQVNEQAVCYWKSKGQPKE